MPSLRGTKTHNNLKEAFSVESQANRRYLYFAKIADSDGKLAIAEMFREIAELEGRLRARPSRLSEADWRPRH